MAVIFCFMNEVSLMNSYAHCFTSACGIALTMPPP
jgi:hypothetical protein